jgi:uncharacterized protein
VGNDDRSPLRARRSRWPWISLLPLGIGAWAPIVAGVRAKVWWWAALGVGWLAVTVAGWISSGSSSSHHNTAAGGLLIAGWAGGIVTSFAIRPAYERRLGGGVPRTPRPAWPAPSPRSRQWTVRYALVAYVATFVGANAVGAVLSLGFGAHLPVGAGVLIVDAFLLGAFLPLARRRGLSLTDLGLRPTRGIASLGLVIGAVVLYAVFAALWALAFIPHSAARTLINAHHDTGFAEVIDIIALSVSAPVVEEVFFRGLLYRSLRNRLPVLPAALIAGALFGLVHITGYPLITLPIKAAFGVLACLLYERTGSILPGIAAHAFVDGSAADITFAGNDTVVLTVAAAVAVGIVVRGLALPVSQPE